MGLLGSATAVEARTGRKRSNALTLTFKTSKDAMLGVATQLGGIAVLFGFKNGGSGRYELVASGQTLAIECGGDRTSVSAGTADNIGTIEHERGAAAAVLRSSAGKVLARLHGQPEDRKHEAKWLFPVVDDQGATLGTVSLLRASFNLTEELTDAWLFWDHAGASLKLPSLGARLELDQAVESDLGDLLLVACVDLALGGRSFTVT